MREADILEQVRDALSADGFELTVSVRGAILRGTIAVTGIEIPLRLEYRDLEFCEAPRVFVETPERLPRRVIPHLDEDNELCAVDRRQYIADRYYAAAEARGLVIRSREVLERGLTHHATEDIAAEFPQHWGGGAVRIEFGEYEGPLEVNPDSELLRLRPARKGLVVGAALRTNAQFSFKPDQARPNTLAEVLDWARVWDADLPTRIVHALENLSPTDPCICLVGHNGTVVFQLIVSARGKMLVKALSRQSGWRKALSTSLVMNLPIRRSFGQRVDLAYALGRSGGDHAPLAGKTLLLVGCGAIGGFLARALVQLGGGFEGGCLQLVDDETLTAPNIGRHVLGLREVDAKKATALREMLERDFPGVCVRARETQIQDVRSWIGGSDLLLDATGEVGVSEMLNAWMLAAEANGEAFPGMLHAWVCGAGAAAQTFMSSDPNFGCFRCLKPDHGERHRYTPLTADAPLDLAGGCGEQRFTPYGPSAPMAAAALAAQHAADWSAGKERPLLRTLRVDLVHTNEIKPVNPPASPRCPACNRA